MCLFPTVNDSDLIDFIYQPCVSGVAVREIIDRVKKNGNSAKIGRKLIGRLAVIRTEMENIDLDLLSKSERMRKLSLRYFETKILLLVEMGNMEAATKAASA